MSIFRANVFVFAVLLVAQPALAKAGKWDHLKKWSTLQGQIESMLGQLQGVDRMSRKDAEHVMGRFRAHLSSAARRFNGDRTSPDGATQILQQGLLTAASYVGPVSKIGRERDDSFRAAETLIAAIRHTKTKLPYLRRTSRRLDSKGETQGLTAGEYKRLKVARSQSMHVQMQNTLYARQRARYLFNPPLKGKQPRPSWRHPVRRIRAMLRK